MGQTAEELRAQIEDQRAELSRDMQAIGDRVSPGRMVERRRAAVRRSWHDTTTRLMGSAETAGHQLGGMGQQVGDAGSGMAETARNLAERAEDAVRSAPDMARQRTEGAPILAGALAFGVGALVAAMLPTSDKERELTQRYSGDLARVAEGAKEQLAEVARETKDHVAEDAKQAMESVTESAKESGQQVKEAAASGAHEVKDQASGAIQDVKGDARS